MKRFLLSLLALFLVVVIIMFLEITENIDNRALLCPNTEIKNISTLPWNDYDDTSLKLAKVSCSFKDRDLPCLVTIVKKGRQEYDVFCGAKD